MWRYIGCDWIFDNLSNEDIIDTACFAIDNCSHEGKYDIHLISLDFYNMIIKNEMDKYIEESKVSIKFKK